MVEIALIWMSLEIALIWMSLDFNDDQSPLVQVMAWCRQATSHYLSQCWPRSLSLNGVRMSQYHGCWCLGSCLAISSTALLLTLWYGSLPSMRKDFNHLHHLSIKKWQKIMIANKLYIIYFLHPILFTYKSAKINHQWIIRHCRQRWLFIVMSPHLICDVMPTCIVTSYLSMVLTCANWHKVDLH